MKEEEKMPDVYLTPIGTAESCYTEKRSRFLGFAHHVSGEEEAKEIIKGYRNKYHDARHVCFAYVLGSDAALLRAGDDGEPAGTAGRPIQGVIRSRCLTDCLVVVVRYFGGVKLGTPGLIAAYREATVQALDGITVEERYVTVPLCFDVPYTEADLALRRVREAGAEICRHDYSGSGMTITLAVKRSAAEALREGLSKIHTLKLHTE